MRKRLFPVLCPETQADRCNDMEQKYVGVHAVIEHLKRRNDAIDFDEYSALMQTHDEDRLCKLLELMETRDPWLFHCFLETLRIFQSAYFDTCVRKCIKTVCASLYSGLISSVFTVGHTMQITEDIFLNIYATYNGDDVFVDIRKWKGPDSIYPTTDGVCLTDEEFKSFVRLFKTVNETRKKHSALRSKPIEEISKVRLQRNWGLGRCTILLLTGCRELEIGMLPGVAISQGYRGTDPYLRLCDPGREDMSSAWYIISVAQSGYMKKLSVNGPSRMYRGHRRKYLDLLKSKFPL